MAQMFALIVSETDEFRKSIGTQLRSSGLPLSVADRLPRDGVTPDLVIVDIRGDAASAMATIERFRTTAPAAGIFAVAHTVDPDLILKAMRSGANEFFAWPPPDATFHEAVHRTASRRESSSAARAHPTTLVFLGAKGGAGTTTLAVNCGVELARLSGRPTVVVDLKSGLGEVALFLGVRCRYSLLDALDNLHRLDAEFLRELVARHKSGLEILSGSDQFERPGPGDNAGLEEVLRLLARHYEHIVIDAGTQLTSCAMAALYTADSICLVANPDVPSIRNAQRLLERIRQFGSCGERVRVLLNRAAEPHPIPLTQIESVLGLPISHTFPSDYRTVSTALNSGVALALAGNTELSSQFDSFTRQILQSSGQLPQPVATRRSALSLERFASIW
jgi:pilus assembly protein CpaE